MKLELFLVLLVLLASTNVFGQQEQPTKGRKVRPIKTENNQPLNDQSNKDLSDNTQLNNRPVPIGDSKGNITDNIDENKPIKTEDGSRRRPVSTDKDVEKIDNVSEEHDSKSRPIKDESDEKSTTNVELIPDNKPLLIKPSLLKRVHVSGNIILVKYRSSVVGSVEYDVDGTRTTNNVRQSNLDRRFPYAQDFIVGPTSVILYVSTMKTTDPKLSFAKFPIKYDEKHFPLTFDIDIDLPDKQHGLLERADITLYFFVYITHLHKRIDTFIPAGTSQILLQGTNRLVQKLDVFVRASGIEVNGLFRGRFGERYIRSDTTFQIFIISEENLININNPTFDYISQLTITDVPAMFPVPFSLLVQNQMLKLNRKYYAIAFIFENGIRRLINQEPILIINEQTSSITSQIIFNVIPYPFLLRGTVARSMPGSFILQSHSKLILRLHEIGSNKPDITFRLPNIISLPQMFQINISQSIDFDPSKNYDIGALISDEKNNIYMGSLQSIPLLDELTKITIPVDDLLYNVQARIYSSSNQRLSYIPGSSAQIFVTETPETPTKPIVSIRIDSLSTDFREFSIQIPVTAIQRGKNYYLVTMIESNGTITHVSKTLLISNNQPPSLTIQIPIISLNLISGSIFDIDNHPAQWSSSSFANLYLIDDAIQDYEKSIVQIWKIHLENDFPVRFEVEVDFSRLHSDRTYRLEASIENNHNILEYRLAGSTIALSPNIGISNDVRLPVANLKTSQLVKGLIYIDNIHKQLPEHSEIIVQLSSSPSLTNPTIIDSLHFNVSEHNLPINFTMNLPLNKINLNSAYYFLVQYIVNNNIIIPSRQAFAFLPRNEATVVITLSKTPQIPITGQVTSTGSPLILPLGSTLHLYITDDLEKQDPIIFSEVFLQASVNSLYEFTMNIDSIIIQKKIPLYLRADIIYDKKIILSIPRGALLQITPGGEWNINLVVDVPTLLIGKIISLAEQKAIGGELDVYIQILERGTTNIVHIVHIRVPASLPQDFRIEIDNELFARYRSLQARAVIKNCRQQIIFESGGAFNIRPGLNIKVDLPVILTDLQKFNELQLFQNQMAPITAGKWSLSVIGTAFAETFSPENKSL